VAATIADDGSLSVSATSGDPSFPIEASWTLGVSRVGTFRRVIVPQSIAGLVTGAVLSFAHTIGEFGVVLMVGGNIPGETCTVSVEIYDQVKILDYAAAGRTSLFLLAVSFIVLSITYALQRNFRLSPLLNPR
jgi:molybdate transport system permease protein